MALIVVIVIMVKTVMLAIAPATPAAVVDQW